MWPPTPTPPSWTADAGASLVAADTNAFMRHPPARCVPDELVLVRVPHHDHALAARILPEARLDGGPLDATTAKRFPGCRVLSVMIHDAVSPDVLARFPRLEAVITRSDGYDHLPEAWMQKQGVAGYHLEGYATGSVAQITLSFIIALLHRIQEAAQRLRTGPWTRDPFVGRDLREVTVGILGTGRIGGEVARHLLAMGADVVAHDPAPEARVPGVRYLDGLPALGAASDVLTLHVPLTDVTRGCIDREALSHLPDGALLVNAARGEVVDQDAVLDALASGRLAGYAADVLPGEPEPPALPDLLDHPNVIVTPHLGAHNTYTIQERYRTTAHIARAVLAGDLGAVANYRVC